MRGPSWTLLAAPTFLIGVGLVIRESLGPRAPPSTATTTRVSGSAGTQDDEAQPTGARPAGETQTTGAALAPDDDAGASDADAAGADAPDAGVPDADLPDAGAADADRPGNASVETRDAAEVADASVAPATEPPTDLPAPVLGWSWATTSGAWTFGDPRAPSSLTWDPRTTSGAYGFGTPATPAPDASAPPGPIVVDLGLLGAAYLLNLSAVFGALDGGAPIAPQPR